ncbi:hypothetical protein L528_2214 [Bordetella bronchiseptica MBORD849]|nr:hypothetical protein L528_2214 [Bordetella bronchiseptica MBORD849]
MFFWQLPDEGADDCHQARDIPFGNCQPVPQFLLLHAQLLS